MDHRGAHNVSGKTVVLSSAAGLALGGPFLVMMGFTFLSTLTFLLLTSPLLFIFSPLIFGAACIFAFAMAGFTVAVAMAFIGLSFIALVFERSFGPRVLPLSVIGFGEAVKEQGDNWAGYLQHRAHNPQENYVNRA